MLHTPEIKAQLAAQKAQCLFCKLIAKEIESKIVFEDDAAIAVLDINPALKGHTLFLLKEHYPIMPYIPPDEFRHYFGLIPKLSRAVKEGIVRTGMSLFIANGGIAGQQSSHFLIHLLPRENGDGFFNFLFSGGREELTGEGKKVLVRNFPLVMENHFRRIPAVWHRGKGNIPPFLEKIYESSPLLYEDERVLVVLAKRGMVPGHVEIYSKTEVKLIENLSEEEVVHLFYTASCAASLLFEGLKAQGTNIILKSGRSDDNPEGGLVVHVLPRKEGDGLPDLCWKPRSADYDLDSVASKIKDRTWKINYQEEKKKVVVETKSVSNDDEIGKAIVRIKK